MIEDRRTIRGDGSLRQSARDVVVLWQDSRNSSVRDGMED